MPLTLPERDKIRYFLGYLSISPATGLTAGVPQQRQTLFILEANMNNILEVALPNVRRILGVLDDIECAEVAGVKRLAASSIDALHIRPDEEKALVAERRKWIGRLGDILHVPPYLYASTYQNVYAGSIKVVH